MIGFDIGGTKCAVSVGEIQNGNLMIENKKIIPTDHTVSPYEMIDRMCALAEDMTGDLSKIGISCGGPLDSEKGLILSPPNLPGWDQVEIVSYLMKQYGGKVGILNDANACALAEWQYGAGKGCQNMIFLTFGSGMGAGLILNGRLYNGTNDMAGEVGHMRLESFGPVGYGKAGSFEGFCSGGGIAQLGYTKALEKVQTGEYPLYFKKGMTAEDISAKSIAEAADKGDKTAIEVYRICGEYLGRGLSVVIDILNPQVIVLGSIFARSHHLLWESTQEIIKQETLPLSAGCCQVVPAELGESIGDYAAIATALE